nr:amidophosphoribosyltransferase [bacterium]
SIKIHQEVDRDSRHGHFTEMNLNAINPTELVASLINQEESFAAGLSKAQEVIKGSCSILILTAEGIYAARDRLGRTPLIIGRRTDATAVAFESSAFPNLGFETAAYLGPGEVGFVSRDGYQTLVQPGEKLKICSFLWIYYGYPASSYEGINVEQVRYRCGAALACADGVEVDMVSGIPDSGIAHAIGYAVEARLPYNRPFVKYTPTWPRSFMPQHQEMRDLIANMKLIPISDLIAGKRMLLCEDSIVRGTQLRDFVARLYAFGGAEVHMRVACPPLLYGCPYLNFSRSRSLMDLAARRAVIELLGSFPEELAPFLDPSSDEYAAMTGIIRKRLGLTTLKYQTMPDMIKAIGLPCEKLCTFCWTGSE